ncbi:zinc finger MYM-type protein 1-like [Metopolophium dirhodum]|uniref:zinc finger MYM-type protein 1-like n=1 Tax=Metopolophium dirhodum TaxID=44670 RepID=UPI0029907A99|nr:zinc finger MYM-type protein 1-like [Metopolophium dirhodum]
MQFLSGHGNFRAKLAGFNLQPSPICACGTGEEDVEHVLFSCPLHNEHRAHLELAVHLWPCEPEIIVTSRRLYAAMDGQDTLRARVPNPACVLNECQGVSRQKRFTCGAVLRRHSCVGDAGGADADNRGSRTTGGAVVAESLDCDKEINVEDLGINKQSQALEIIHIYSTTLPITETKTSKDNIYLTEQFIPKNDFLFPKTNGRSCQLKWFNSFSWLHYVKEKNVVLCYPCALASQTKITKIKIHGQESFIGTGFQNWKKGTERFSIHEKSENHRASIEYLNFRNNSRPVISLITEQSLNEQKEARTVFKIVISSIRYLARSGQAIRGGTWDSGNLIYLLQERSLENLSIKIWLEKRNNWLSGDIQNELLETMAHFVLQKIKNSVLKSPFMAIMADGTTDGQEQFSICFRFLNTISLNINEIFVGMYNPSSGNAETLFSCITDLLTRMCLSFENVRGLCFDGAATMSGHRSGVQKRISDVQPKSIFIHCSNHSLDLALSDTIKTVDFANDALNLIRFVSNTILDSSKRKNIFSGIVLSTNLDEENDYKTENIPGIILFCPTRWTVRVKAVNRFIENYERVLLTVQEILKDSNSISKDRRAVLRVYETKLWKFETFFALESLSLILGPCEQLAKALQNISYTAIGAKHSSELVCKPPANLEYSTTRTPSANIDKKVALRKEFFALIDCLLNELNERFTQSGLDKVVSMETILMRSINTDKIEISEIKKLILM